MGRSTTSLLLLEALQYFVLSQDTLEIGRMHEYFSFHLKELQRVWSISLKQVQTKGSETGKQSSNLLNINLYFELRDVIMYLLENLLGIV